LRGENKRYSGYFPKKPRICDYMVCPALTTFVSISKIQPNEAAGSGAKESVKAAEHLEKRDTSYLD